MKDFQELVDLLSVKFELPLEVNEQGGCTLNYDDKLDISLEVNPENNHLVIVAELGEVPEGPYRENLLRAALISNGYPYPRFGSLAINGNTNQLMIIESYPLAEVQIDPMYNFLKKYVEKAFIWYNAVEGKNVPDLKDEKKVTAPGNYTH